MQWCTRTLHQGTGSETVSHHLVPFPPVWHFSPDMPSHLERPHLASQRCMPPTTLPSRPSSKLLVAKGGLLAPTPPLLAMTMKGTCIGGRAIREAWPPSSAPSPLIHDDSDSAHQGRDPMLPLLMPCRPSESWRRDPAQPLLVACCPWGSRELGQPRVEEGGATKPAGEEGGSTFSCRRLLPYRLALRCHRGPSAPNRAQGSEGSNPLSRLSALGAVGGGGARRHWEEMPEAADAWRRTNNNRQ
jgi:hypothetical protein